jgi:hypothetical protein
VLEVGVSEGTARRVFRLTCGLKRLFLYEGGERGTNVPHGLHTLTDTIVPDGWRTTVAALVEFTGIFLPPPFYRDAKQNYWLLVPLLAGSGRYPPGYGNSGVNHHHYRCLKVS